MECAERSNGPPLCLVLKALEEHPVEVGCLLLTALALSSFERDITCLADPDFLLTTSVQQVVSEHSLIHIIRKFVEILGRLKL